MKNFHPWALSAIICLAMAAGATGALASPPDTGQVRPYQAMQLASTSPAAQHTPALAEPMDGTDGNPGAEPIADFVVAGTVQSVVIEPNNSSSCFAESYEATLSLGAGGEALAVRCPKALACQCADFMRKGWDVIASGKIQERIAGGYSRLRYLELIVSSFLFEPAEGAPAPSEP